MSKHEGEEGDIGDMGKLLGDPAKQLGGQKRKGEMQEEEGDLGDMGMMLLGDPAKRLAVNKGGPVEMESDSTISMGEVDSTGQPVIQAFQGPCSDVPHQTPTTHKSEGSENMEKRAAEENLEDDPEFRMFREWAKEAEKEYKNHDEECKRFQLWRSTKEMVDAHNSRVQPGMDRYAMTTFSDLTDSEKDQFYMKIPRPCPDVSPETPTTHKSEWQQKMEKRDAEEKAAFDNWVAEHERDYGNELERIIGFMRHRLNMRRINTLIKKNPSSYSTSPVELGILLDQVLTLSEIESLLSGCTAPLLDQALTLEIPGPCPDVSPETPTTHKSEWQQKLEKRDAEEKAAFDKPEAEREREISVARANAAIRGCKSISDLKHFKEWAKENKKEYETVEELSNGFKIWRSTRSGGRCNELT